MRNWHQMWQVCQWEFLHFFKLKQEIISKLIMLGIGLAVYFWQGIIQPEEQYQVGLTSEVSSIELPEPYQSVEANQALDSLLTQLNDGQLDAVVSLANMAEQVPVLTLHTNGKLAWHRELTQVISQQYSQKLALSLGLNQSIMDQLQQPVVFNFEYQDQQVKDAEQESTHTAIGVLILICIGVLMSFTQIFVSITGEKQQRVTEQLYACMDAQTWIDGKILGQMLHAIKTMAGMLISMLLVMAFVQVILNNQPLDFSFIDFRLLPIFSIFALLGLYMVTAFMAAIAASIDDPNHSGKSSFMMMPLLPIVLCFFFTDSPSSLILSFMSYFPLTAFAAMPMKMALIDVAWWQVTLAILSTAFGCYIMRVGAGRMFKAGMVMYGKEPDIKQMLSWALRPQN